MNLSWERNTTGLKKAAQNRRLEALTRTEDAIKKLLREKRPIDFTTVAQVAQVARSWLYQQPEIKERIIYLREQTTQNKSIPLSQKSSEASKDAMIMTLKQQIKQLKAENQELIKQIEIAYGLVHEKKHIHFTDEN